MNRADRRAASARISAALGAWALGGCALPGPGEPGQADGRGGALLMPPALPPDIVVAADGSGDFRSVNAALQSIPRHNLERRVVQVKAGVYTERVQVQAPFVTLRGAGAERTRIAFDHPDSASVDKARRAVLDIGPHAHDLVVEQLTVHNTHPVPGVHAFAVLGRADRTVVQDCALLGVGNDTLSLWRGATEPDADPVAGPRPAHGGRYYHARLQVQGSVDFVCPRGWCHMVDSQLLQVNPRATASVWHDGRDHIDKKFVLRGCRFDGPPGWVLARRHVDAHLIFIDCRFSATLRDQPPYRVGYADAAAGTPLPPGQPGSPAAGAPDRWGDRFHFHGCHRDGGDHAWLRDNLHEALGRPRADEVTARWTFAGSWDPESRVGPAVSDLAVRADGFELLFDEAVCVKGQPALLLADGSVAQLEGVADARRVAWRLGRPGRRADLAGLRLQGGALLALQAGTAPRHARLGTLPA